MAASRGTSTTGVRMASTDASDSTRSPPGATPPAICIRAKPARSRAVIASIDPAGAFDGAMAHSGAGVATPASSAPRCPTATRCRIAS